MKKTIFTSLLTLLALEAMPGESFSAAWRLTPDSDVLSDECFEAIEKGQSIRQYDKNNDEGYGFTTTFYVYQGKLYKVIIIDDELATLICAEQKLGERILR